MSAEPMSTEAMPSAVWLPFQQWRLAFAALRKAEAQRKSHAELVRLSEEVIRTRNMLIAARLADGSTLPAEAVRRVEADAELLRHPDGTAAPNRYFPGADAHVSAAQGSEPSQSVTPTHVRSWRVDIDLFEAGDDTAAHAVLVAEAPHRLEARGEAHRKPGDVSVPEIGDEVAVARALRHLSDQLLATASLDLADIEGHQVRVSP